MNNYVQEGDALTVTAPYAVTSGHGVLVGTIFGVAYHDAVTGQEVEISREGVFNLAAVAADVAASGAPAYWDNTARAVTTAAAVGNILIGAFAVSKSGATTVARVVIDGTIRLALV